MNLRRIEITQMSVQHSHAGCNKSLGNCPRPSASSCTTHPIYTSFPTYTTHPIYTTYIRHVPHTSHTPYSPRIHDMSHIQPHIPYTPRIHHTPTYSTHALTPHTSHRPTHIQHANRSGPGKAANTRGGSENNAKIHMIYSIKLEVVLNCFLSCNIQS